MFLLLKHSFSVDEVRPNEENAWKIIRSKCKIEFMLGDFGDPLKEEGKVSIIMKKRTIQLTTAAIIAALYALLTLIMPFTVAGTVELRLSEALTVLPIMTSTAIPGLTVGCLLANALHGANPLDVVFGALATLLAAICSYLLRKKPLLALAMPAIFNGIIVGWLLAYVYKAFPFHVAILSVMAGELIICYCIGYPLMKALNKTSLFSSNSL